VNQQKNATMNYELGKTISHTVQQVGVLKRISLAVVVNHRTVQAEDGTTSAKPLTDEEKQQITELIKQVVGFSQDRGDTLNLVNAPFTQSTAPQAEETPLWKNPELVTTAKEIGRNLLIAGIALYLVLGVLKPMLKTFAVPPPDPQALLPAPDGAEFPQGQEQAKAQLAYESNLQAAKQIARQDPKLVANVVKGWVTNDG
jgi:flagellar M-ring protein FliF